MAAANKRSRPSELSLAGLHSESEPSRGLKASDIAELSWLLSRTGTKVAVISVAQLAALQRAIRKVGRTLYEHNIPHIIVGCRRLLSTAPNPRIEVSIAVPEAAAAFELLRVAGFRPDPVSAFALTDRREVVCIRLLSGSVPVLT
jgi:hypothetical protein